MNYDMFNNMYDDFLCSLIQFFPNNKRLPFYRELSNNIRSANYRYLARLFISSIAPHSIYIFNKDESYFLNKEGVITKTKSRAYVENALRNGWLELSQDQRNIIWKYLQSLLLIVSNIEDLANEDENGTSVEEETINFQILDELKTDGVLVVDS